MIPILREFLQTRHDLNESRATTTFGNTIIAVYRI